MELESIGKNIRKFRLARKLRQEELAEQTGLSTNYIGMIERGEKVPSLESFITISNALDVSADMLLCDVIHTGYEVKNSLLTEKMKNLRTEDRDRIYDVVETLLKHTKCRQQAIIAPVKHIKLKL